MLLPLSTISIAASTWFRFVASIPVAATAVSTPVQTAGSAGISPDIMAAAGSTSASATLLLGAIAESSEAVTAMFATRIQSELADAAFTEAARLAWIGGGGPDMAAVVQARDDAAAAALTAREAMRSAALAPLSEPERAGLNMIWSNRARRVPMEFRVLALDEATWRAVGRALLEEERAAADETDLDPEMAALLRDIRDNPAVVASKQSMAANLQQVQAAFASAAAPPQ